MPKTAGPRTGVPIRRRRCSMAAARPARSRSATISSERLAVDSAPHRHRRHRCRSSRSVGGVGRVRAAGVGRCVASPREITKISDQLPALALGIALSERRHCGAKRLVITALGDSPEEVVLGSKARGQIRRRGVKRSSSAVASSTGTMADRAAVQEALLGGDQHLRRQVERALPTRIPSRHGHVGDGPRFALVRQRPVVPRRVGPAAVGQPRLFRGTSRVGGLRRSARRAPRADHERGKHPGDPTRHGAGCKTHQPRASTRASTPSTARSSRPATLAVTRRQLQRHDILRRRRVAGETARRGAMRGLASHASRQRRVSQARRPTTVAETVSAGQLSVRPSR